jgi:transposase-like protein
MAMRYSDEFRRDAVRIATTSGLTRPKVASDLGIGLSTPNKWVQKHPSPRHTCRAGRRLLYRTRATFRIRQEGGAKKGHHLLCRPKPMRFAFIDAWKEV